MVVVGGVALAVFDQEELDLLGDALTPPLIGVLDGPERLQQLAGNTCLLAYLALRRLAADSPRSGCPFGSPSTLLPFGPRRVGTITTTS